MEVVKGFIHIPVEIRMELTGSTPLPFPTTLNGNPARFDNRGRLWSSYLKNRFPVGAEVIIRKVENGYRVESQTKEKEHITIDARQQKIIAPISSDLGTTDAWSRILEGDCLKYLSDGSISNVQLTFFDPPYRQGKDYRFFDDSQPIEKYWGWIKEILHKIYDATLDGGAIYFMQREKNTEKVLRALRNTGWTFQNLIIWRKKTSAVPCISRFSKQYQIIAYAIKGDAPRVFNKVRIDLPPLPEHKYEHENGVYLTDVWEDIRELTSGYFAGDEAIRDGTGNRVHVQQSPVALLLRIILSSTKPRDIVLDPLAGTGTALVVAKQLDRNSIGIEIDPENVALVKRRVNFLRPSDNVSRFFDYYRFTPNLKAIWQSKGINTEQKRLV
jgi:site-specific DNA-methyltransferase (adenine-specific)